jgi:hypothetical protein
MAVLFNKLINTVRRLTGSAEKYQSAVTFAESNSPEFIEEFMDAKEHEQPESFQENPKLLVIGNESLFPDDVVEYALDMAKRMSYEIVALNSAPLSCDTFKLFSSSRDKICNDFKEISENSAASFKERALAAGVPFSHCVKFTETDNAIKEVINESGPIDFIVSDNPEPSELRPENDNRPRREIFVYSLLA